MASFCAGSSPRPAVPHVQVRRSGVVAAVTVRCLAASGRSRPALDGHDDAAAETQLGADELSVLQQAVTHHRQGRPKLLIGVAGKVHVVDDDDATLAKRGHSPAQLEDLPAGRVREDQVIKVEWHCYVMVAGLLSPDIRAIIGS